MSPEQIIEILETLAQKLTPPAQYAFELAVRQILIDGAFSALSAVVALLFIVVLWVGIRKGINSFVESEIALERRNSYHTADTTFPKIMGYLLGSTSTVVLLVAAMGSLKDAVNYLLNPEYWVLMRLAELIP